MSKTIKQIAEELGVSKTAIRKYMTPDFRANYVETTANGVIIISDEGANQLESLRKLPKTPQTKFAETTENQLESLRKLPKTPQTKFAETTENQGLQSTIDVQRELIAFLKQQLAAKDEQITVKDEQIKELQSQNTQLTAALQQQTAALESTTAALTAAQALHAADKKQMLLEDNVKMSFWERRAAKKAAKKKLKEH